MSSGSWWRLPASLPTGPLTPDLVNKLAEQGIGHEEGSGEGIRAELEAGALAPAKVEDGSAGAFTRMSRWGVRVRACIHLTATEKVEASGAERRSLGGVWGTLDQGSRE